MKKIFKLSFFLVLILLLLPENSFGQYSSTKIKTKHEKYTDSLKNVEYNYIFPILGQQVYNKGFDIPYPVGVMANAIWMKQDIVFSNFQLGFSNEETGLDIPLTDVGFIQFGQNHNDSQSYTLRPDIWVLPFLNVYGLFGRGASRTEVQITFPLTFTSIVEQEFSTNGIGFMAAGGVGPVWLSADFNWTWSKPDLLDKPVRVNVMGLRMGHTFVFNNRPHSNIALWVGAMHMKMNSETSGQIALIDALPPEVWDKKDQFVDDYYTWYDSLDPNNPIDAKIIEGADKVLTPIIENINDRNGETTVKYAMDKQTKQMWNGTVGAQYQLNKHWQFRTEVGFLGNRKSYMASFNYRFLL